MEKKFSQVSGISKENAVDLKTFRLTRVWIFSLNNNKALLLKSN